MQTGQNPQYPNENRKKRNRFNLIFTVVVIAAVAVAASAILVTMALVNRPSSQPQSAGSPSSSLLPGDAASGETSSLVRPEDWLLASSETSGTPSEIELSGTNDPIPQSSDPLLVIVNNTTPLPSGFAPNLAKLDDVKVDKRLVSAFEDLYEAGAKAKHYYWVTYGYRTEKQQNTIYQNNIKRLMEESNMTKAEATEEADKTIQKGGASEYITGLSIGVNTGDDAFGETSDYQWLVSHCADYGFILRYPADKEDVTGVKFQPWRFRYVGKAHAKKMQEMNLCLEEYVVYLNRQTASSETSAQS
ncbi:MAG: M15 family metallopeptidase [Oscillospiraceae bacterium]|nr:M15 family metallopeptidase [Oscillospiraceae bacterium]